MMITERVRPYETLIRYNDDGSVGMHHVQISEIVRDGVVIAASLLPPEPIIAASDDATRIFDATMIAAVADANTQRALVGELQNTVNELQNTVNELRGVVNQQPDSGTE